MLLLFFFFPHPFGQPLHDSIIKHIILYYSCRGMPFDNLHYINRCCRHCTTTDRGRVCVDNARYSPKQNIILRRFSCTLPTRNIIIMWA